MSTVSTTRVIILEPLRPEDDINSLHDHGPVLTIFGDRAAPSVFNTNAFVDAVLEWCRENEFDPKHDAFVLSGRLTKISIALAAIVGAHDGAPIRVLMYDGLAKAYKERQL